MSPMVGARRVVCPYCGYTLFWSRLPIVAAKNDKDAWVSIRCQRRTNLREHAKCRRLVYLTIPGLSRVVVTGVDAVRAFLAQIAEASVPVDGKAQKP